ncbi:hypothetical protein [Nitrospira sp. Nam74]
MSYRIMRQASVLPPVGLIIVMAVTGCETAGPDETPRLIMEQSDETAVVPGQPEQSLPPDRSNSR